MKIIQLTMALLVLSLLTTCGGDDDPPDPINITFVNSQTGSDVDGTGTKAAPFKTLTFVLNAISSKDTIQLMSGIYDSTSGETFPIIIPANKTITGSIDNPAEVIIRGTGTYFSSITNSNQDVNIVLAGDGATISNSTIEAVNGIAVWEENNSSAQPIVFNSVISASIRGVVSANASTIIIADTLIMNNDTGIELFNASTPILVSSEIIDNTVGITIQDEAIPLFNFFASGSANTISNNSACDLRHFGSKDFSAVGVLWDDDVFDFTISDTCIAGANIVNIGLGNIDYQFIPPENSTVFPSTNLITVESPGFGEIIFTQEPNFTWTPNTNNTSILVVMDHPPALNFSRIVNIEHISWFWHQGLGRGSPGRVNFSDGAILKSQKIDDIGPPVPLTKGRSYYWAIWEWNEDNTQIISSSALNYFRISSL